MAATHGVDVPLEAPIVEVTLMEDRARVARAGRVRVPAGTTRLRVADVAPVLADKSVVAHLPRAPKDAKVLSVRVERSRRSTADRSEAVADLERERADVYRALQRANSLKSSLERRIAALGQLAQTTLSQSAEDVGWATAAAAGQIEEVDLRETRARERWVATCEEIAKLDRRERELKARIDETEQPTGGLRADLVIDLLAPSAGEVDLRVEYVVPGACWRPHYVARLSEAPSPCVSMELEGCVWQRTGEDWKGVQLSFSTQRPSLGAEPPRLATDLLRARPKPPALVVQAREQAIRTTGEGAWREVGALPGVDDGGSTVTLRSAHAADVPCDGRPSRVPILSFSAPAEVERVLQPEASAAVYLKSVQANASTVPLLAGPVDLLRGGGLVGRTSVLYVAPGEKSPLAWGPDGALRARRETETPKPKEGILSSWITQPHQVTVKVSNLGPEPRELLVTERVPVSEVEQVQIEVDTEGTTDRRSPDGDGLVRWTVSLAPFGKHVLRLAYSIRQRKDVIRT